MQSFEADINDFDVIPSKLVWFTLFFFLSTQDIIYVTSYYYMICIMCTIDTVSTDVGLVWYFLWLVYMNQLKEEDKRDLSP